MSDRRMDLETLARELVAAKAPMDATEQRVAVALLRLLAEGTPVPRARLAEHVGLPSAQVATILAGLPWVFFDDQGRVDAFIGLALRAPQLRGRAERPDDVELLPRIAVPALVVVGRDDEFTPIGDARLMQERIPDATLAVVEGSGHLPNLERPIEFNATLGRFPESVAATAPTGP